MPSFDIVRVEPNGDSVIAGRAAPGATIELLRNGEPYFRALADESGAFALVPPPLPPGSHEIVLQSIAPDGTRPLAGQRHGCHRGQQDDTPARRADLARQAHDGAVEPGPIRHDAPPTNDDSTRPGTGLELASAGPATGPGTPPVGPRRGAHRRYRRGGRRAAFRVRTGGAGRDRAAVSSTRRLIAPGAVGADGKLDFVINRGVKPGSYRIRLDDVDPVSGEVKSRAEVPYMMPVQIAAMRPAQPHLP